MLFLVFEREISNNLMRDRSSIDYLPYYILYSLLNHN